MRTRTCLILTLILTITIVHHCQGRSMLQYHQSINEAELSIVVKDYGQALKAFNKAFTYSDNPFAADLYNACVCAIKIGDNESAMKFCARLTTKGVGREFFEGKKIFEPLKEHPNWENLCKSAEESKLTLKKKTSDILSAIDSLVTKDQFVNHQWRNSGETAEMRKVMDITDDSISRYLISMFDKYGFLSEDVIGVTISNGNISPSLPFDVIIIHNYQSRLKGFGDTLFTGILTKALKEGKITPQYFARIQDFAGGSINYGSVRTYMKYKCNLYFDNAVEDSLAVIEQRRIEIGLSSFKDLKEKILFNIRFPENDFRINALCPTIESFANKQSEERFLNTQTLVYPNIPNCVY